MGNTIKNFEKKRRKQQEEDYRKMKRIVHNTIMERCPLPKGFKEKEYEVFNVLIR